MEDVENTADPINASARLPQPADETEKRNQNLDILKAYIQRQRALLERIKRDVECLQTSKHTVAEDPSGALSRILRPDVNGSLDTRGETYLSDGDGIGKLSELASDGLEVGGATITKEINWEVFRGQDITPLHSLPPWSRAASTRSPVHQYVPPLTPSTPSWATPKSSLSSFVFLNSSYDRSIKKQESVFQTRVREMRVKAVDPALTIAAQFLASLPPDSDDDAVRQARAKESRDAKEARVREAKEARNTKSQNGHSTANARPAGHVKKSAHRRKSEASAAAAASRPRGQGGRFKKKEQIENKTLVPHQTRAAGAPDTAASVTSSIYGLPNPDQSVSARRSITPSVEDLRENSRPQRSRKPSIRFGYVAPSASSTRSGSNISATANGKAPVDGRLPSSSPMVPNGHTRGRLTIRIPARSLAKEMPEYGDRQTSASTSMTGSTSVGTSESASTDMTASAEHGHVTLGGKCYGRWPIDGDIGPAERELISSNSAMMRSVPRADFLDVKQEEVDEHGDGDGMHVDEVAGWDIMEEQNARFKQESVPHQATFETEDVPPIHNGAVDSDEDDPGNDSDDSFVCEMLPPLPGSSASSLSTSADRGVANDARNGSTNGKADAGRYSTRRGNPSSKTFNMTWSDEEQRLLDMLLVQFPDGTKNRWANISRAMGGSRTPRQVASRVQKYFAKMKKWGIDVG